MNRFVVRLFSLLVVLLAGLSMAIPEADARRLGGGKSFGRQSAAPIQRDAVRPPQQAAPQQAPQRPGAAPGQTAGNRWLAPLAGIAAGLGLAALASHLGLGEAMGTVLLLLLLVVGAVFVLRAIAARRGPPAPQPAYQGGYSASQLGREAAVRYSADESATPAGFRSGSALRSSETSAGGGTSFLRIPEGFDVEGFERNAKVQFVRLQAVFDAGDTKDLREFTTPEMYAELALQIDERRDAENRTDVVTLDATLLGIDSTTQEHVASVRFSGMIREELGGEAKQFDEVWNLVKPANGPGGWVLAGIQQLD